MSRSKIIFIVSSNVELTTPSTDKMTKAAKTGKTTARKTTKITTSA
jgi:hypothetical protein